MLAVVQGLTEFLPVSSSGHLVAARTLLGIPDVEGSAFDAFLHLGTLLAVLVYYRRTWAGLAKSLLAGGEENRSNRQLALKLAAATVPAAAAGYALQDTAGVWLRSPAATAAGLAVTGVVLLAVRGKSGQGEKTVKKTGFWDALLIGAAQAGALAPGVSRSGVTIAAGRARGLGRRAAVTFSFLLSAPIIAGAGLAGLFSLTGGSLNTGQLLSGLAVSFLSGLAAISGLLYLVKRISFLPFAVYVFILAAVLLYVS